jgi:actin-related protein 3
VSTFPWTQSDLAGFAGNDSPSFVFPTAIATKGGATTGGAGTGSGRPAVASKPTFLTGGAGPGGQLSAKRGTEDLDFFIGDEAITAAAGPGTTPDFCGMQA